MTAFEYVLPLVSVLVGLALADLAVSLHRLLRARRRVRWDWLPLAAALLAALAVLNLWWGLFGSQGGTFYRTLGGFLPLAVQLVVLFLLNAAALPDAVPDGGLDLRAFYDANGPYFWSLYAVLVAALVVHRVGALVAAGASASDLWSRLPVQNLLLIVLFVVLARVRRRGLHAVAVPGLLALFLAEWAQLSLGPG